MHEEEASAQRSGVRILLVHINADAHLAEGTVGKGRQVPPMALDMHNRAPYTLCTCLSHLLDLPMASQLSQPMHTHDHLHTQAA